MLIPPSPGVPPTGAAVLLVLLPLVATGIARQVRATTRAMLDGLQLRLGTTIQILVVEEENNPDVVRSFRVTGLPTFLLLRQGIELWRQPGLPEGEFIVEQLLRRLHLASGQATPNDVI
ncbi:MAG: hypothetical protein ACRYG7_11100 [Janthinobacterium lividum]